MASSILSIRHRLDDLEKAGLLVYVRLKVRHRLDDLEKCIS
ncbi:hypothetical protein J577_2129 [Acinetobacter sp. 263903-1]|nr:hypothetical protein J577_2129 [Acinetobacter sp. 263903-1]